MLSARTLAAKPALTGVRLASVRPSLAIRRPVAVKAGKVPEIDAEELKLKASEWASDASAVLKEKWEKTEDKPAAVLVAVGTIVGLSFALSIVNTVDKIPIVSDFVELVGLAVSGWFVYRYLTVGPDRDELFVTIKNLWTKIYGSTK